MRLQQSTTTISTSKYFNYYYILTLLNFIFSCLLFNFAYLFQDSFHKIIDVASYLTWHNIFEFTGILVSYAVFAVAYFTYKQTQRLRSIFLGCTFLAVGLIDFFHTLSFKGMAEFFILNNSANRATTFWIVSSMLSAIGYLIFSFIPINKKGTVNRLYFLIPALMISIATLIIGTYYPESLPSMYIEGVGLTKVKILLEYIVTFLLFISALRFIIEFHRTQDDLIMLLANALLFRSFSELAFTAYGSVYDIYNYIGHIYKFISVFIIFRIVFIYNVQKPYFELSETQKKLQNYADNLDKIVAQRTQELEQINQKLLDDLDYARDIQKAMMPTSFPKESEVSFEARYYPAERVSGDFYNVFKLDEQRIGLYIGDVSGHGVPAAMLTIFLHQSIHPTNEIEEKRFEVNRPSTVLEHVYLSFNKTNFKEDVYLVMFYAIYNLKTGQLTYSSAGLNVSPLIIKSSGEVEELKVTGFPICKFAEFYSPEYHDYTLELNRGDRILFYTDGLVEAEGKEGKRFSTSQLKNIIRKNSSEPAHDLVEIISSNIFGYMGDKELEDDLTYFVMQVN